MSAVVGFRFEIGTIVKHCGQTISIPTGKVVTSVGGIVELYHYLIVERHIQECHGGRQYSYRVRGVSSVTGAADGTLRDFQEFEVDAVPPDDGAA